ncbi:MAG: DMT family transporter [Chitinophagaceae bacterium]
MNKRTEAHLALLFTNLFFAINLSAVKFLTNHAFIQPFGLNLIRVGVSVILFWILFLFKPGEAGIKKKDIGAFVLCAITGVAINQLLFVKGLSMTYPIHASLLMLTTPLFITFIAAWLLKETPSLPKFIGLGLGITGALLLILNKGVDAKGQDVLLGNIFIITNAISYSFYFVLVKPLMQRYHPIHIIRWIFTLGFFMVLPFGWQEFTDIAWQQLNVLAYGNLAMIVIGGTFLAYLFNAYGIKVLGSATAGTYIYTQPVMAAIIAMLFLGEQLSFYKVVAAILIFAGLLISNKSSFNA